MRSLAFLVIFLSFGICFARGRGSSQDTQIYFGFGIGKSLTRLELDDHKSEFDGYIPSVELGMDFPIGEKFGLFFAANLTQLDMTNTKGGTTYIEKAYGNSLMGKAGFFYGRIGVGGGFGNDSLVITQVSTVHGTAKSEIKGQSADFFINYSLNISQLSQVTFEVQQRSGDLDVYKFSETSGIMRFSFLFPL